MIITGAGRFDNVATQVDPTYGAVRTSVRPVDVGIYGSYRKALKSGVIAAGLTGPLPVWEMRWGQSDKLMIVRSLKIQAVVSTTAFNATAADSSFSLYRAQGFSALDGTNGTYGLYTQAKTSALSTRFPNTQFALDTTALRPAQGGIVILNTSASGLTGGTKVNDTDPISIIQNRIVGAAAAETVITPDPFAYLIDPAMGPGLQPLEFSSNEGLVLTIDAVTATGTWRLMVELIWDEVDPVTYFAKY